MKEQTEKEAAEQARKNAPAKAAQEKAEKDKEQKQQDSQVGDPWDKDWEVKEGRKKHPRPEADSATIGPLGLPPHPDRVA